MSTKHFFKIEHKDGFSMGWINRKDIKDILTSRVPKNGVYTVWIKLYSENDLLELTYETKAEFENCLLDLIGPELPVNSKAKSAVLKSWMKDILNYPSLKEGVLRENG